MSGFEYCGLCGEQTGRAGRYEDSLYFDDEGPFCDDCHSVIGRILAPYDRLVEAARDVTDWVDEVVDRCGPEEFPLGMLNKLDSSLRAALREIGGEG